MTSEMTSRAEPPADTDEIERDLQETRARVGATVEELTGRLTAKARPASYLTMGIAVVAVAAICVAIWRRRR